MSPIKSCSQYAWDSVAINLFSMWRHNQANMETITDSEAIQYFVKAIQSSATDLEFCWEIPQCCHQILTWQLSSNVKGLALQICLSLAPAARSVCCSFHWVLSSTDLRSNFWLILKFHTEKKLSDLDLISQYHTLGCAVLLPAALFIYPGFFLQKQNFKGHIFASGRHLSLSPFLMFSHIINFKHKTDYTFRLTPDFFPQPEEYVRAWLQPLCGKHFISLQWFKAKLFIGR